MISVLIPVFNFNVAPLVAAIHSQLLETKQEFEIICIDDFSTNYYFENDKIKELNNVIFYKLSSNIGRSKIRNLLAEKATYNWLLFLDADVFPKGKTFIKNYLNCIKLKKEKIFCGGIVYQIQKPEKNKMLRWVYGKDREEISAVKREGKPYSYFFGANFLLHKSVFKTCRFNEIIVKYGYEDVLFATDLKKQSIAINHLDNAVFHLGIETNAIFLAKTKNAIENLYDLNSKNVFKTENIKILNVYTKVKKYKLTWFLSKIFVLFSKLFEYNLKSNKPSIFIFDIYKLTYLCYLSINPFNLSR